MDDKLYDPDNPPILRADGTYRPLDLDLVERLIKNGDERYRRDPEFYKGLQDMADFGHGKVPLGDGS